MTIKLKFSGVTQSINALNESYADFLERLSTSVETALKSKTPVRTGRAKAGWDTVTKNDSFSVSNSVPYVPFLERGTTRMRAANKGRGIIGPALDSVKGKLK